MYLAIFNLGPAELGVILVVALLVFGGRLPDVARSLGKSFTQFKRGLSDLEDDVDGLSPTSSPPPLQPPRNPPDDEGTPPSGEEEKTQEPNSSSSRDATS
jgi:sec-independent protein translocase protein TatA